MSKVLKEAAITTANSRSKLAIGEHPRRLDADSAVWYRKGARGGVWFARWRNNGSSGAAYKQAPIGPANDINDKPADGLFTYPQAEKQARKIVAEARIEAEAKKAGPVVTVRTAVESYIAMRDARDSNREGEPRKSDAGRLRHHVIGREKRGRRGEIEATPLADVALHSLSSDALKAWRKGRSARTVGDLRAALNKAWDDMPQKQRELNPTLPSIIRDGLKPERIDDDDAVSVARENQILTDGQIAGIIGIARNIDTEQGWDGDLFRMIVVLAATGMRYSQAARLKVADLQRAERRIMVLGSYKGRGGKRDIVPVPVGQDVLDALLPAVTGRAGNAVLLERQRYARERVDGRLQWQKSGRGRWKRSKLTLPWQAIRERAGLDDDIDAYCLRHTSIVRCLRKMLPITQVAKMHNTSARMIERHYARYIAQALENLAREAVVPLVPQDGDEKVITMRERA